MTFLEIVRRAALDSGTMGMSGTNPATIAGATGRGLVLVGLVRSAWQEIQTERNDWRWMREEFVSTNLSASISTYGPDDLLADPARFRAWLPYVDRIPQFSLYRTSEGASDERPVHFIAWPEFRSRHTFGAPESGRPGVFSIDDRDRIRCAPAPAYACTLRGMYRKSAQTLTADIDEPECPEEFHMLIVFRALLKLANFDEAPAQAPIWHAEAERLFGALVHDQTELFYV